MKEIRLNPSSAKALAHPLRMRMVGSLRLDGPATASMLAERLGVSSGLTSYHVRRLADAGFVEPDPDRVATGRERWWRAAHEMTSWQAGELDDDPDARASDQWLVGWAARSGMDRLDDWLRRRPDADAAWRDASSLSDYAVTLSPAELHVLNREIDEVVRRHLDASTTSTTSAGDDDRAEVTVLVSTFPRGTWSP